MRSIGNGERTLELGSIVEADDLTVEIKALTQAQADKIMELVNTTTKVQNYDEELMQMITNESEAFFAGQKSAEDVGRLLQSKMTIYINEQR